MLSCLEPGDLLFYSTRSSSSSSNLFTDAVRGVVADSQYFHVAIVSENRTILEATPEHGVVERVELEMGEEAEQVEGMRVMCEAQVRRAAANWAATRLGCGYNSLFSPDCRDPDGNPVYYCSQFIEEAYGEAVTWPPHKLSFSDKNGEILEYWREYYEMRGVEIPHGERGSHPGQLRRCEMLMPVMRVVSRAIQLGSLKESKGVLEAANWINGAAVELESNRKFDLIEPRSGHVIAKWSFASEEHVTQTVKIAGEAQRKWASFSWMERGDVLRKTAELLRKHCDEIAHWECIDNGKPIYEARMDVLSCVDTFNFYSGIAHDLLGRHIPLDSSRYAYTKRVPVGIVAAIGAWNYPIQTCSWKTAPALACGNSIIYKPSPLSPVSPLILGAILKEAGLPDGAYNVLQGDAETGAALIHHDGISKVSFTGSIPTGKAIMKACAERSIKPITLELGGKSSLIVFEDGDVESAVACAMMANFFSQGQVCSNASKVLVHRSVLEQFTELLIEKTRGMKIGDPLDESTKVGAHITAEHRDKVKSYIDGAVREGAKRLFGGERVEVAGLEGGFYLSPCILGDVRKDMKVYKEEIFGSVLLIIPFDNEEEAIEMANDTKMGLAAGIVTKDLARTHRVVDRLNAGNVYVNTYNDVSPLVPFGGMGESGFGRENGTAVLEHYTQIKSVFVNTSKCDNPF